MSWTDADKAALLAFKKAVDSDDIKIKEQIKQILLKNRFLIHVLHNEELEADDAEPDDYFGVNILPYYIISPTQTNVKAYLCYETNYTKLNRYNATVKTMQVIFYILCHQSDICDEDTGVARHDLLAALIQHDFNYTTSLGARLVLVSDAASVVDNDYACRTLTFEMTTDNNVVKTYNGTGYIVNKRVQEYVSPT